MFILLDSIKMNEKLIVLTENAHGYSGILPWTLRGLQASSETWSLEYREHITFLDLKIAHLSNGFMLPTSSIPLKCRKYPLGEVCRTL